MQLPSTQIWFVAQTAQIAPFSPHASCPRPSSHSPDDEQHPEQLDESQVSVGDEPHATASTATAAHQVVVRIAPSTRVGLTGVKSRAREGHRQDQRRRTPGGAH